MAFTSVNYILTLEGQQSDLRLISDTMIKPLLHMQSQLTPSNFITFRLDSVHDWEDLCIQ